MKCAFEVPLLVEELLAINGCWVRERHFLFNNIATIKLAMTQEIISHQQKKKAGRGGNACIHTLRHIPPQSLITK